jgi:thiol-disulfide isomerase/thioredoxin
MKRINFIAILLIVLNIVGCGRNKETVITGSLTGSPDLKSMVYTVPLSGTSFMGFQTNYEKELIALFEQFEKDYPNSEYAKYVKPQIDEIIRYHRIIEKPFDETMQITDSCENINSLEEAIKPLKGKKIYIDVWATWCNPCKREFKHQQALKKILDEQNIQQLYISIDEDSRDRKWKDGIKFYGLSGTHIRANKELSMDLYKRFDRNTQSPYISIPWYILVDENGNIIREHAETPSEIVDNPEVIN